MPAKRISMRKVREVLRLKEAASLSNRQIARCVGIARSTVADYLSRAEAAGLQWPLPDDLDEADLDRLLFPEPTPVPRGAARPMPDWNWVHDELGKKGVTLQLLHIPEQVGHPLRGEVGHLLRLMPATRYDTMPATFLA